MPLEFQGLVLLKSYWNSEARNSKPEKNLKNEKIAIKIISAHSKCISLKVFKFSIQTSQQFFLINSHKKIRFLTDLKKMSRDSVQSSSRSSRFPKISVFRVTLRGRNLTHSNRNVKSSVVPERYDPEMFISGF